MSLKRIPLIGSPSHQRSGDCITDVNPSAGPYRQTPKRSEHPYEPAWRDHRLRRTLFWIALVVFFPVCVFVAATQTSICLAVWLLATFAVGEWNHSFECPRCLERFSGRPFA